VPQVGDALYLTLRALHILGAVLFLGGLVTAMFWKLSADRSNDAAFAARVHRRLRRADARIVGPGALVTFAAGYLMIRLYGTRIIERRVALWGLILMFAALALWYFGMRRLGDRLAKEADALAAGGQPLSRAYAKASVGWLALGGFATALVTIVAVMMSVWPPAP
jgi:uncharacterized membrane protein